jgi:LysR family transcriptional activator of nhaA
MRQWMNYHHLYYFKTIAEQESVSKAATILRLGQPTLSSQLKLFEESIGVPLFLREGKRLILTEHGKIALEYAKDIFSKGGELAEALRQSVPARHTILRVAALDSIAKQILINMTEFIRGQATARVVIAEGKVRDLLWDLDAGRHDILVTNHIPEGTDRSAIHAKRLSHAPVAFFGAKKFKHLQKNFPKSLNGQPLVLPTYDSKLRSDIDRWGRSKKILFDIAVETQDIAVKKMLAIDGLGLIPVATHSVMRQVATGELYEIGMIDSVFEDIYFLTKAEKSDNPLVRNLVHNFTIQ